MVKIADALDILIEDLIDLSYGNVKIEVTVQ